MNHECFDEKQSNDLVYEVIIMYANIKKHICHLHLFNIEDFYEHYGKYIKNINKNFSIIITFHIGNINSIYFNFDDINVIQIHNHESNAIIYALDFIHKNSIEYEYILFLHSNAHEHLLPFIKNKNRIYVIKKLLSMNKNLLGILLKLPLCNDNNNCCDMLLQQIKCENKNILYTELNCMILTKKVIDCVFLNNTDILHGTISKINITAKICINAIKDLSGDYLLLDKLNLMDSLKIKLNAIYFPQFHEIKENNEFWGNGFTEWTLLKPFAEKIKISIRDTPETITTLKPHTDIGYYSLSKIDTLKKQIEIANKYKIN
jgi:hypothetical protein